MRLFSVAFCALLATPVAALAQGLPPGPGADVVTMICQGCHDLNTVTSDHHDVDGWHSVLTEMVGYGATLTDAQADQVATYLATNFGAGGAAAAAPAGATPAPAAAAPDASQAPATPAPATPAPATPAPQ